MRTTEVRRQLREHGFTVVPLLGTGEIRVLRRAFDDLGIDDVPFMTTIGHSPREVAVEVNRLLIEVLGPPVVDILGDMVPFAGSFMSKAAGSLEGVEAHPDWTYVDERLGRSYMAWCPLIDVDVDSGALHVAPGSHRWTRRCRGSDIPMPYRDVQEVLLAELMVPLSLSAGIAVVIDAALVHSSPPNPSPSVRPVAALGIRPRRLDLVHHRSERPGEVCVYAIDDQFFSACLPHEAAGRYPLVERYPLFSEPFDEAGLRRVIAANGDRAPIST